MEKRVIGKPTGVTEGLGTIGVFACLIVWDRVSPILLKIYQDLRPVYITFPAYQRRVKCTYNITPGPKNVKICFWSAVLRTAFGTHLCIKKQFIYLLWRAYCVQRTALHDLSGVACQSIGSRLINYAFTRLILPDVMVFKLQKMTIS